MLHVDNIIDALVEEHLKSKGLEQTLSSYRHERGDANSKKDEKSTIKPTILLPTRKQVDRINEEEMKRLHEDETTINIEVDSDDNSLPQTTTASTTASVRQILDPVYEAIAGSQQTNKAEWESFSSDLLGCRESLQRSFL